MGDKTNLEKLRESLVGSTVLSVDPVPNRNEGGIALFRLEKEGIQRAFSLHATELGSWIESRQTKKGGRFLWDDANAMLESVGDHTYFAGSDCEIEPLEDPWTRAIGFRDVKSGVEWLTGLTAVKTCRRCQELLTPENRKAMADEFNSDRM